VVDPGVSPDPSVRPQSSTGLRRIVLGQIRLGRDDDGSCAGYGSQRIGRSFGISVGEPHAGMQPCLTPFEECRPGPAEDVGGGDADVGDAVGGERRGDLVDRRDRLRSAHTIRVRRPCDTGFEVGEADVLDRVVEQARPGEQFDRSLLGRGRRLDRDGDEFDRPVVVGEQMGHHAVAARRGRMGDAGPALDRESGEVDVRFVHTDSVVGRCHTVTWSRAARCVPGLTWLVSRMTLCRGVRARPARPSRRHPEHRLFGRSSPGAPPRLRARNSTKDASFSSLLAEVVEDTDCSRSEDEDEEHWRMQNTIGNKSLTGSFIACSSAC
jgi:hypothetical protein